MAHLKRQEDLAREFERYRDEHRRAQLVEQRTTTNVLNENRHDANHVCLLIAVEHTCDCLHGQCVRLRE